MAFGDFEFCEECVFGTGEHSICDECEDGECFMPEDEDCMRRKPMPALDAGTFNLTYFKEAA